MAWIKLGFLVVSVLPKFIGLVEKVKGSGNGAEKKAAVKDLVQTTIGAVEDGTGKDFLNDAEVSKAYDAVNDAIVAFQNILAKKAATTTAPTPVK